MNSPVNLHNFFFVFLIINLFVFLQTTFQKSSLQQSLYFGPDGSVSQEKTSSLSSLLCLDDEDDANEVSSASSVSKSVSPPTSLIRPPTIPDYQWLLGRVQNLESDLAALRMELSEMKSESLVFYIFWNYF